MANQPDAQCYACEQGYPKVDLYAVYTKWMCVECLRGFFAVAMGDEEQYPVKIDDAPVHMINYRNFLDPEFVASYEARERQYNTPLPYRLFCCTRPGGRGCGLFIGDSRTYGTISPLAVLCPRCNVHTCICNKAYETADTHDCTVESILAAEDRGITWQQCPNNECRAVIEHGGDCNEMRCRYCKINYCHVCGQAVPAGDLHHWNQTCPRWPATATRPARFDHEAQGDEMDTSSESSSSSQESQQQFPTDAERDRIATANQTIVHALQIWPARLHAENAATINLNNASRQAPRTPQLYTYSSDSSNREFQSHIEALMAIRDEARARSAEVQQEILDAAEELRSLPFSRNAYALLAQDVLEITGIDLPFFDDPPAIEAGEEEEEEAAAEEEEEEDQTVLVQRIFHLIDSNVTAWRTALVAQNPEELERRRRVILSASDFLRGLSSVLREEYGDLQGFVLERTNIRIHDFSDEEEEEDDDHVGGGVGDDDDEEEEEAGDYMMEEEEDDDDEI